MKEINYDELEIDDNEQIFHMWEPLEFEIKDDYKYINENVVFNFISNTIFIVAAPILYVFNKIFFGFKIEGKENLKKIRGGKITVSNHIHPMDCTMNGLINFPKRVYYPTLATNFKIPIIKDLIRILYAIPIPEKISQKEKFLTEIKNLINKGKTVHFYPEGSLWPYYEKIRKFQKGSFKISVETNCPIVPILYKFEDPEGVYKLYKKKKCIHAKILEPIYPDLNLEKNERIEKLKENVKQALTGA